MSPTAPSLSHLRSFAPPPPLTATLKLTLLALPGSNEAATLGALWVNLVAVSGGMVFLIFSELRYRSPAGAGLDPAAAGAEMAALSPGL